MAQSPNFNFIGNVTLGSKSCELPLAELRPNYDSILFAYGATEDRKLDIPGEELSGIYSARAFVGWYNGLPEYADLDPRLDSSEDAVIIGQGNVALDVARTLLSPLERLKKTDITSKALEQLAESRVKRLTVVGRRGPLQAPYTTKEVRELLSLPGVSFTAIDQKLLPAADTRLPRQLDRLAKVLQKGSSVSGSTSQKYWALKYMLSPARFEPSTSDVHAVGSVTFDKMHFSAPAVKDDIDQIRNMRVERAKSGAQENINTGLVFRSIGYRAEPIDGLEDIGVPFDTKLGIMPNDLYGRVMSPQLGPGGLSAGHVPGMYCAGWVKRGPTGVIATTMDDAFVSADIMIRDWQNAVPFIDADRDTAEHVRPGWSGLQGIASRLGIRRISWSDWEVIDKEEKRRGQSLGKDREKCKSVAEMLAVLDT